MTLMPSGATSTASPSDAPSSANFEPEYADPPSAERTPASDDIWIT